MDRNTTVGTSFYAIFLTASLLLLGWKYDCLDGFHWLCGGILTAVVAVAALVIWHQCRKRKANEQLFEADDDALGAAPARSAVIGILVAIFCVVVVIGLLAGVKATPAYSGWYDGDKNELEAKLAALRGADEFEEAVRLIRERLQRRLSPAWKRELQAELFWLLIDSANSAAWPTSGEYSNSAIELAHEAGLDPRPAVALKSTLEQEDNARQSELQRSNELDARQLEIELAEQKKVDAFAAHVTKLQADKQWRQLDALLRAEMQRVARHQWAHPLAEWQFDTQVEWGRSCSLLDERIEHFTEAVQIADDHELNAEPAASLLQAARAASQRLANFEARMGQLRSDQMWEQIVAEVRVAANRDDLQHLPLAEWLVEACVESAIRCDDLETRIEHLVEAEKAAVDERDARKVQKLLVEARADKQRRQSLFDRIAALRMEGKWSQVVSEIKSEFRISKESGSLDQLRRWYYEAHYRAADQETDTQMKQAWLDAAMTMAERWGFDTEPARSRLVGLTAELKWRTDVKATVQELIHQRGFDQLVGYLKSQMEQRHRDRWFHPLDEWLFRAFIAWGDHLTDPSEQREKYVKAIETAIEHGLDSTLAEQRRIRTDAQLAKAQLPAGARAGIVRISTDGYPAALIVDVWLETADGVPIRNLDVKDFQITVDGQPALQLALAAIERKVSPRNFVVLLDTSVSTTGLPLAAAKSALPSLLAGIQEPNVFVRILHFNDRIEICTDWTQDIPEAAASLNSLRASGRTALFKAIIAALDQLATRNGDKAIVVFTDGADTVGGAEIEQIISRCKKEHVVVYAIGLRTENLDVATLSNLAGQSSGFYVESANHHQLIETFQQASRRIRRSVYRLVITPDAVPQSPVGVSIHVSVGAGQPVTASVVVPETD